eukprot:CAMPEP_0115052824 /NCGR_PEP_ID=MMETSP0227-20121206/3159_1 /TAXON_ID=89957 /ORGANISM="Polarella glacialis, Strain CCMP 1383" /LENGTH=55 /DNA_ID=CAMNT_0002437043 /DNA_START=118 /DNA_END=282 /DNA_ORIENTATION=+
MTACRYMRLSPPKVNADEPTIQSARITWKVVPSKGPIQNRIVPKKKPHDCVSVYE